MKKNFPKGNLNTVNQLLNDIVLYNDVANDFSNEFIHKWKNEIENLKSLEADARKLLEKAVIISNNHQTVNVAVVGNFSAGKSSFINSLIEDDICPVSDKSTTSSITTFSFAHEQVFYSINDLEVKNLISPSQYKKMIQHGNDETVRGSNHFFVEGPWEFVRDINLIDTPGFERGEDAMQNDIGGDDILTENVIKNNADVLFWLMDVNTGSITKDQKQRLQRLREETNNSIEIYVVLNKADQKTKSSREKILQEIKKEIGHLIVDVILYSSLPEDSQTKNTDDIVTILKGKISEQSFSYKEKWELKISSSPGGRGTIKFHYHDDKEVIEFVPLIKSAQEGKICKRYEVQDIIKEIGLRNKELVNKHFHQDLRHYNIRKQHLSKISEEIKRTMDNLFTDFYQKKVNMFSSDLENFSTSFVTFNIDYFQYSDIKRSFWDIVTNFISFFKKYFENYILKVIDKYQYSIDIKEIDIFGLESLFSSFLQHKNDVSAAMSTSLKYFIEYLKTGYFRSRNLEFQNLNDSYNIIYEKLN